MNHSVCVSVFLSQCIHRSNHHVVHLKYLTILFLNYTSIKLKEKRKEFMGHGHLEKAWLLPFASSFMAPDDTDSFLDGMRVFHSCQHSQWMEHPPHLHRVSKTNSSTPPAPWRVCAGRGPLVYSLESHTFFFLVL